MQYNDKNPRGEQTLFGPASLLADDGKTAQIPDAMRTGR